MAGDGLPVQGKWGSGGAVAAGNHDLRDQPPSTGLFWAAASGDLDSFRAYCRAASWFLGHHRRHGAWRNDQRTWRGYPGPVEAWFSISVAGRDWAPGHSMGRGREEDPV